MVSLPILKTLSDLEREGLLTSRLLRMSDADKAAERARLESELARNTAVRMAPSTLARRAERVARRDARRRERLAQGLPLVGPGSRLTPKQQAKARMMRKSGMTYEESASHLGTNQVTISAIVRRIGAYAG